MSTDYRDIGRVVYLSLCVAVLTACSSGGGGGDADPSAGTTGGTINTGSASGGTSSGGGAGSGSGSDKIAPTVTSTTPANGNTGVARNAVVTATFSEDIANATVDNATFTLTANGQPIGGSVALSATNITQFTPSSNLPYLTQVTATLTTGITDVAGNPLANAKTWSFTTTHGGTPTTVNDTVNNSQPVAINDTQEWYGPRISVNNSGAALIIWSQPATNNPTIYRIWLKRYSGNTWTTEVLDAGTASATHAQAMIDNSGNIVAIWQESGKILARQFSGNTWGAIEPLDNSGAATDPQIGILANGDRIAIWSKGNDILASRFNSSAVTPSWEAANPIDNAATATTKPHLAVTGNVAMAVWQQSNGTGNDIISNRFNGPGWGGPQNVETGSGSATNPRVALASNGDAIAVWEQDATIKTNRYSSGWGSETSIESLTSSAAQTPQIAIDNSGNALAVWRISENGYFSVRANRYTAGGSWGTAQKISNNLATHATAPKITISPQDQALAIWFQSQPGTGDRIWVNRYSANSGWNAGATRLGSEQTIFDRSMWPAIAITSDGKAIASWWQRTNNVYSLWMNFIN